ncbi:MAG: binding-protein-dependent transport system inner rane component [Rhodospirillales bacterium]|nr:binding-protein-dependent transport system inner rane component [Rhodospirillales bacterium]
MRILRNPSVLFGALVLAALALAAIAAPLLHTVDPVQLTPRLRLKPPTGDHWFGTDGFGRDLWSRVIYGARISLAIGAMVSVVAVFFGLAIGLAAGFVRWLDGPVMRVMDGIMAIPAILLAIAMVSLNGASLVTVAVAIVIPEIPRVARLIRSVVLSVREEPYVEAAVGLGTRLPRLLWRHVLPNTLAPLVVQGTYVAASAILTEAILSFLGAGIPTEIPSWGNAMAEGRVYFQVAPWIILFPGLCLAVTVLAVNLLGDGLRDLLDPRLAKSVRGFR